MNKLEANKSTVGGSPFALASAEDFLAAQEVQGRGDYESWPTYPRSGTPRLARLERKIGELIGAESAKLYCSNSGMSSVSLAVELAELSKGDLFLYSPVVYGRTEGLFENLLARRGIRCGRLNSLVPDRVEEEIEDWNMKCPELKFKGLFVETVGNGFSCPVVDVEGLVGLIESRGKDEILILDNTLATNLNINLPSFLQGKPDVRAIVVESLTKFYRRNLGLGGVVYSYNGELESQIWQTRTILGSTPDTDSVEVMKKVLPESRFEWCEQTRPVFRNTGLIAELLSQVDGIEVNYPGLSGHPDMDLAKAYHPSGYISPVCFVRPAQETGVTSRDLFLKLDQVGGFEDFQLSDSFGFDLSSVYYSDRYGGYIRIAGGREEGGQIQEKINGLARTVARCLK